MRIFFNFYAAGILTFKKSPSKSAIVGITCSILARDNQNIPKKILEVPDPKP